MRKRHDYEDNEDYDTLVGMLSYTKNTREDFKKALSWAVQNGFPIDYSTEGSEYWGIKPRPPLLHETMFYSGYEEETKIILDLGSDVNVQDSEGNTALIVAAGNCVPIVNKKKWMRNVKTILEKTNNINHLNNKKETAFGWLCKEFLEVFFEDCWKEEKRNIRILMRIFLDAGADPNLDSSWFTDEDYHYFHPEGHEFIRNFIEKYYQQRDALGSVNKVSDVFEYAL